jgi:hypothetical protein
MATIASALTLDSKQFQSAITQAQNSATTLGSKLLLAGASGGAALNQLSAAAEKVKEKMNGIGGAIVGAGLVAFAASAAESVSHMVDLANSVGVSTQAMMEMNLAAVAAGQSGDDMARMLQKMNIAINDSANGNTALESSFNKLGLSQDYLRSHTLEETFKKAATELGKMEDASTRAKLSMDLFGKGGTRAVFADLAEGMDKYAGTQKDAAEATVAAKKVMDELAVGAQVVKNEFILLAKPVIEWVAPFVDGLGGAKAAAVTLAGAMTLFATAGVINAIKSVQTGVTSLMGSLAGASLATGAESTALVKNTMVTQLATVAKLQSASAGYAQKVASLEASIATMKEAGMIQNATIATRQLITAKANLAAANASLTATSAAATASVAAFTGTAVVATPVTWSFAAAWRGLGAAITTTLGPLGLAAAAVTSLYAVKEALVGDKHGIFSKSGDQSGANWISDLFNVTDRAGDEAAAEAAKQAKKVADEVSKTPALTQQTTVDNSGIAAARLQSEILKNNNRLANDKLQLEIDSVGMSEREAQNKKILSDAEQSSSKEVLRIQGEINKLLEQASSLQGTDSVKADQLRKQAGALGEQVRLIKIQAGDEVLLKGLLLDRQEAHKKIVDEMLLQNKIADDLAGIEYARYAITANEEQKALADVQKRIDAEVNGQIRIQEAKNGGKRLTEPEIAAIRADVTPKYDVEKERTKELVKANQQEEIRLNNLRIEEAITANIRNIQADANELTMTADEAKINSIRRRLDEEVAAAIKLRELQTKSPLDQSSKDQIRADLEPKFKKEQEATQVLIDQSRSFSAGWTKAWKDYADSSTNAAEQAKATFQTMTGAIESAFDQLVKTGSISWKSLLQDMTVQLMKADFQKLLGGLMGGKSGGGNIFSEIGALFTGGKADGGFIPAGAYGIVGEKGPERISGPANITPMGSTQVTYNINAVDARSFQQMLAQQPELLYALTQKGSPRGGR